MNTLDPNLPPNDQLDQNLVLSQNVTNRIIEHSNDSILISLAEPIDQPGPYIIYANQTFLTATGYRQEEIIGQNPRILQGPQTDLATLARVRTGLTAWQPVREEVLNYKKNGETFWQELNIFPLPNDAGQFTHWVSIQRDITERKIAEQQIYDLAFLDPLTGLPNRRLFYDRLHRTLLNVITEGVETKEQLSLLVQAGCRSFQGYAFYKPLTLEAFEAQFHKSATITKKGA